MSDWNHQQWQNWPQINAVVCRARFSCQPTVVRDEGEGIKNGIPYVIRSISSVLFKMKTDFPLVLVSRRSIYGLQQNSRCSYSCRPTVKLQSTVFHSCLHLSGVPWIHCVNDPLHANDSEIIVLQVNSKSPNSYMGKWLESLHSYASFLNPWLEFSY